MPPGGRGRVGPSRFDEVARPERPFQVLQQQAVDLLPAKARVAIEPLNLGYEARGEVRAVRAGGRMGPHRPRAVEEVAQKRHVARGRGDDAAGIVPEAQAELYAVDARGVPVPGVTVAPTEALLVVAPRAVLQTRTLPLRPPPSRGRVSATLVEDEVVVAGPRRALETLQAVPATLPAETSVLGPGRYTLEATLTLPDGVTALSTPQLRVDVRPPTAP